MDLKAFLGKLGLLKYLSLFQKEEVDFQTLTTMTDDDLRSIGLTLFGPRRKILLALEPFQAITTGMAKLTV
eukprot:m.36046 g.36046  ORF g.36046 m.36046 type:complete len:71 (-) comp12442_c0_seq1:58-270(-)